MLQSQPCLILIISLITFINKLHYSRDVTIFMISSIHLFEIINFAVPYPSIFLRVPACANEAATVNSNGIQSFSAHGLSFLVLGFTNSNPVFSNGSKSLTRNLKKSEKVCLLIVLF